MKIEKKVIMDGIEKQKQTLEALSKDCLLEQILLEKQSCSVTFDKSDEANLSKEDFGEFFEKLEGFDKSKDSAVYIISAPEFSCSSKKVTTRFDELKSDGFAMCRINDDNNDEHWGKDKIGYEKGCLYVGSSHDIVPRFKAHLGISSKGTYAMHLEKWFWELQKNREVIIEFWKTTELVEEDPAYLQIIEDILWDHYKPLFGRRGAK